MSRTARLTDVSLRDGLQNEPALVPTGAKGELARALLAVGLDEVELTSFVSRRWVPQLGDAPELCALVADHLASSDAPARRPVLSALVPNERGMRALLDANAKARRDHGVDPLLAKASVFTAASETFAQKNTNASIDETLARFVPVVALAAEHGLALRAYVSCVVACPFEGPIEPGAVAGVCQRLAALGANELDLGDTIGAATPETTAAVIAAVREVSDLPITLHLHDTHGRAASCALAAIELGVTSFDASVAGLGGCPYASTEDRRAPGNVSMAALALALQDTGATLSINAAALDRAEALARRIVADARAGASS